MKKIITFFHKYFLTHSQQKKFDEGYERGQRWAEPFNALIDKKQEQADKKYKFERHKLIQSIGQDSFEPTYNIELLKLLVDKKLINDSDIKQLFCNAIVTTTCSHPGDQGIWFGYIRSYLLTYYGKAFETHHNAVVEATNEAANILRIKAHNPENQKNNDTDA